MTRQKVTRIVHTVLTVAVVLSLINIYFLGQRSSVMREARLAGEELMRPAALEAVVLMSAECEDCFDYEVALQAIRNANTNITSQRIVEFDSAEGEKLAELYDVEKLPVVVLSGEVNKTEKLASFFTTNGFFDGKTAVYMSITPPYYDISTGKVVGRVSVIHVDDSSCDDCKSLASVDGVLKQLGVAVVESESVEYQSAQGQELIMAHDITRVPAVLISEDIEVYPAVLQQLQEGGAELKEGYYAVHSTSAPYVDVQEGKVVGLVTLIMLKDESCTSCYDVNMNNNILENFGVVVKNQETYDVTTTSAKALIEKYDIGRVPAVLVSPDAQYYPSFVMAWKSVGTVEEDGWYVMRTPEVLGVVKDVKSGEVIVPQQQQAASSEETDSAS